MTVPPLPPCADAPARANDPGAGRLVIAACSARKTSTLVPVPALELYQGGCVPQLRERIGPHPRLRARTRILSAQHGLIPAETPLLPYDRPLDPQRAAELRPRVTHALLADLASAGTPREALVIAEPTYLVLVAGLVATGTRLHWVPDVRGGWAEAAAVLDHWGWP
jgi:hypothetical protein